MKAYEKCLNNNGLLLLSGFYKEDIPLIDEKAATLGMKLEKTLQKKIHFCYFNHILFFSYIRFNHIDILIHHFDVVKFLLYSFSFSLHFFWSKTFFLVLGDITKLFLLKK